VLDKAIKRVTGWMRDNLKEKNFKDYHGKFTVICVGGKVVFIEENRKFKMG
jgi:hypothetical protein